MSRYTGANCRFCRREGSKLFLKGERCSLEKCAFERRSYAPGQHGQKIRRKQSEYSVQLRAKQKLARIYGVREGQFRSYYKEATRVPGVSGGQSAPDSRVSARQRNLSSRIRAFAQGGKTARASQSFHRKWQAGECAILSDPPGDLIEVAERSRPAGRHSRIAASRQRTGTLADCRQGESQRERGRTSKPTRHPDSGSRTTGH